GQRVAMGVADLHGDSIEQARIGNALGKQFSLTEKAGIVNGVGDMPNTHDILTGSQPDGRAYTDTMDHTCSNYSSNADGRGQVQLGHSDKQGGNNSSWNSTHGSRGCSRRNLSTGFPRLRQTDGYRLLAVCGFLSRPAALQSPAFPLVHRLLDLLLCLLAVSGHFFSPLCKTAARQVPELRTRQMVLISRFTFHNREEKP